MEGKSTGGKLLEEFSRIQALISKVGLTRIERFWICEMIQIWKRKEEGKTKAKLKPNEPILRATQGLKLLTVWNIGRAVDLV